MKRILFLLLYIILNSCGSTKINTVGRTIIVKSNIKEKVTLSENTFKQSKGGIYFQENNLLVKFKDIILGKNNFTISFYNDNYSKNNPYLSIFDSNKKLNSFIYGNYGIEVFNVTSKLPVFEQFEENFKFILIKRKSDDIEIVLENFSNFKDNVSEKFLLEKLKALEFKILGHGSN